MAILDLLQNNGGCQLPCWWGLYPGKTNSQAIQTFLDTLQIFSVANIFGETGGYIHWKITNKDLIINANVNIVYSNEIPDTLEWLQVRTWLERITDGGFEVVFGDPLYAQVFQTYTLPSILSTYGKPSDVLVFANLGSWNMVELLLYYPDQGFIAMFWSPLETAEDKFMGCMSNVYTDLYLWSPEREYTWSEAVSRTTGGGEKEWLKIPFLSLEEATSLTIDEFYTVFKDPQHTTCLETPKSLWPGP